MQNHKLSLRFKDNNNTIEFDSSTNTVFYGNNGKGKTRILKTIHSLYLLSKERNPASVSKIIDDMNLHSLHIDNISFKELFQINDEYKRVESNKFLRFYKENDILFDRLFHALDNISHFNHYSDKNNYVDLKRILRFLNIIVTEGRRSHFSSVINNFEKWLADTYIYIIRMRNFEHRNTEYEIFDNGRSQLLRLEESFNLITAIKREYDLVFVDDKEDHIIKEINARKKKVLRNLSDKPSYYITTDNTDINMTFAKFKKRIEEINNQINLLLWTDETKKIDRKKLDLYITERNDHLSGIVRFNEIIKKYANISVQLQNLNELIFYKDSEEIFFDKLSSGEKKISYLFLEIIFNDAYTYLIDEPELSLSLNYQNKIITDLHILTENKVLFIATHAPYIYEDFIAIKDNVSKEV